MMSRVDTRQTYNLIPWLFTASDQGLEVGMATASGNDAKTCVGNSLCGTAQVTKLLI